MGKTRGPGRHREPSRTLDRPSHYREYLSAEQLAQVSPWSVQAIQKMVQRGVLTCNVHYFQPFGQRARLVFKWSAIVTLIEGRSPDGDARKDVSVVERGTLDVEKATAAFGRLLGR
jgi:hypothetical protein